MTAFFEDAVRPTAARAGSSRFLAEPLQPRHTIATERQVFHQPVTAPCRVNAGA